MLYITYLNFAAKDCMGIKKKVFAQIRAFKKSFPKVFYTCYCGQLMYLYLEDTILEKEVALTKRECNALLKKWMKKYHITRTYIRYDWADKWFIDLLCYQKEQGIKSVLEIPSFPYDNIAIMPCESVMMEDKYYRSELKKYINVVTGYGADKEIFGINCIKLQNGVDIEEYPLRKRKHEEGKLVLLAVSSMQKWNGYERIILGMKNYYENHGTMDIVFKLVGDGSDTNYYKRLVRENHLEDKVFFLGRMDGEKLDKEYDSADIGAGTLGMFKLNLENATAIKLREYCTRGLPFIYGYNDLGFDGNEEYVLKVSNEEQLVDMNEVIEWYSSIKEQQDLALKMRTKAEKEFTWEILLKPVVDYLI